MTITDEDRAEAERLKQLPRADQRQIVAMYRDVALGKGVPAREREAGLARVAALRSTPKGTRLAGASRGTLYKSPAFLRKRDREQTSRQ